MSNATGTFSIRERPQHLAKEEALSISTARTLIAIHSETALAQTTLVPSSYVAEENYLYCNPASNGDKRHGDFRPDLDHEPDIYRASSRSSGFYAGGAFLDRACGRRSVDLPAQEIEAETREKSQPRNGAGGRRRDLRANASLSGLAAKASQVR